MATICVFCGSSSGRRPIFGDSAQEIGRLLAEDGHRLVYGGGHVGLMGAVADAALAAGGEVTGVITEHLQTLELAHQGVTELQITTSMHERKARMAAMSDGVIVLPGGFGTLDEMFVILTWNQLGLVSVPVALLDVEGYFARLFDFVDDVVADGFAKPEHGRMLRRCATPRDALRAVTTAPDGYKPKWIG